MLFRVWQSAKCHAHVHTLPCRSQTVVERHEVLRGHFVQDADGNPYAALAAADAFDLHMDVVDLRLKNNAEALAVIQVSEASCWLQRGLKQGRVIGVILQSLGHLGLMHPKSLPLAGTLPSKRRGPGGIPSPARAVWVAHRVIPPMDAVRVWGKRSKYEVWGMKYEV